MHGSRSAIESIVDPPAERTRSIDVDIGALAAALRVLDDVLGAAVRKQALMAGPATLLDPWRGMHLEREDVERVLAPSAVRCVASESITELLASAALAVPIVAHAATEHALGADDLALLLIALAPNVALKYERVYGYLQDDLTRKRATPDLAANLLAFDAGQRLRVFARLADSAPLKRSGLIEAIRDLNVDGPWLARALVVNPTWVHSLLGLDTLDPSLAACARLHAPSPGIDELPIAAELRARLRSLDSASRGRPHLLISGPHGAGKLALAGAIAHDLGQRVLVVDARDWATPADVRTHALCAARTAGWLGAIVYLHGVARLAKREPQSLRVLFESLTQAPQRFVIASVAPIAAVPGVLVDAVRIELTYPSCALRETSWQRALSARGVATDDEALRNVAARFAIGPGQIEQAAHDAAAAAGSLRTARLSYDELARAARAQCSAELAGLAQRIEPQATLDTLVIPLDVRAQLREICSRMSTRETVPRDWGGGSVHVRATGVTALFAGPSGTGKTLAAEAIARELGYDLYRIDLATIVSKYIGETEQNLDRVFAAAEHANAVLFFDEADALFGKRSEVKDAHDRYANIEIAYLLQKMERLDGLAVLATNLKQNLDEAFARRLIFTVNFPFPERAERRELWHSLWPPLAPRADDVDLDWFAREFRLSGGAIRNTVLAAAHLAAADGRVVTRMHLLHATRREFQKLGKSIDESTPAPTTVRS